MEILAAKVGLGYFRPGMPQTAFRVDRKGLVRYSRSTASVGGMPRLASLMDGGSEGMAWRRRLPAKTLLDASSVQAGAELTVGGA